jgi:hypothetical protein
VDAEAEDSWNVGLDGHGQDQFRVSEEEEMAEGSSEVCAVKIRVFRGARVVRLVTSRTKHLFTSCTVKLVQAEAKKEGTRGEGRGKGKSTKGKHLHGELAHDIRVSHGEYRLALAKGSWTATKVYILILAVLRKTVSASIRRSDKGRDYHLLHPSAGENISGVDEAVEHLRGSLHHLVLLIRHTI